MRRMWIGVALLALILIAGILTAEFMDRTHRSNARDLKEAAALALDGDWDRAEALTMRARKNWQKKKTLTAALTEHQPMEEIESLFAKIDICASARNKIHFATTCAHLAQLMNALSESHSLTLGNLI